MDEINNILKKYSIFEAMVQGVITGFCSQYCSSCSNVCCKPEYCQEALESPFLSLLREKYPSSAPYSIKTGWLAETGCTLSFGRPPVCYEFICNEIMDTQPTIIHRYMANVLSKLISHAGKKAHGQRHVVEIMSAEELQDINFTRFEKQLGEAGAAFLEVEMFREQNFMESGSLRVMKKILPPPLPLIQKLERSAHSVRIKKPVGEGLFTVQAETNGQ